MVWKERRRAVVPRVRCLRHQPPIGACPGRSASSATSGLRTPGTRARCSRSFRACASLSPESEFRCICTNPEAVVARDGIEAVPITTRVARIWDRDIPLARRVPMAFVGVGAELRQYARAFRKLKGTDMLIVPGTGLVTDAFGLSRLGPVQPVQVGADGKAASLQSAVRQRRGRPDRPRSRASPGQGGLVPG